MTTSSSFALRLQKRQRSQPAAAHVAAELFHQFLGNLRQFLHFASIAALSSPFRVFPALSADSICLSSAGSLSPASSTCYGCCAVALVAPLRVWNQGFFKLRSDSALASASRTIFEFLLVRNEDAFDGDLRSYRYFARETCMYRQHDIEGDFDLRHTARRAGLMRAIRAELTQRFVSSDANVYAHPAAHGWLPQTGCLPAAENTG